MIIEFKPFKQTDKVSLEVAVGKMIGHGDLTLVRIPALPELSTDYKKDETNCLALGESSGHAHKVFEDSKETKVELYRAGEGLPMYLTVKNAKATVKHQEHNPVELPSDSFYEVRIKRMYDPFEERVRAVVD